MKRLVAILCLCILLGGCSPSATEFPDLSTENVTQIVDIGVDILSSGKTSKYWEHCSKEMQQRLVESALCGDEPGDSKFSDLISDVKLHSQLTTQQGNAHKTTFNVEYTVNGVYAEYTYGEIVYTDTEIVDLRLWRGFDTY